MEEAEGLAQEAREGYERIVWRIEEAKRVLFGALDADPEFNPFRPSEEVKALLDEGQAIVGQAADLWIRSRELLENLRGEVGEHDRGDSDGPGPGSG